MVLLFPFSAGVQSTVRFMYCGFDLLHGALLQETRVAISVAHDFVQSRFVSVINYSIMFLGASLF